MYGFLLQIYIINKARSDRSRSVCEPPSGGRFSNLQTCTVGAILASNVHFKNSQNFNNHLFQPKHIANSITLAINKHFILPERMGEWTHQSWSADVARSESHAARVSECIAIKQVFSASAHFSWPQDFFFCTRRNEAEGSLCLWQNWDQMLLKDITPGAVNLMAQS